MATNSSITKDYLLDQFKNFDAKVLQKNYVEKREELPIASAALVGKVYQYVGATVSGGATKGYFYQCVLDSETSAYKWEQINVQPQVDPSNIINDNTKANDTTWSSNKISDELDKMVSIDQGTENEGKILKVNEDGELALYDGSDYTITKQATAETGYIATYQLFHGNTAVGDKINIPKDFLVKNVELKVCTVADSPVVGYEIGDKYIDFTINTVDADETAQHLYLLVKDLVDVYTAGNGIDISNSNVVSVKVATNKGLEFVGTDSDELALKVQDSDDVALTIDSNGLKATLIYETTDIDFDTEW